MIKQPRFLPISKDELKSLGWHQADVIIVSGDAYVDHPSFGAALIGRYLVSLGYRVAILPQPRWDSVDAFMQLGEPALCFAVTSGNMDSMVNHYTSFRLIRSDDPYSPDQKTGFRPNRAVIVYTNRLKEAYPDKPVVLGGIEASMRRFVHYDFWQDRIRASILIDARADILVYGQAERGLSAVMSRLRDKKDISGIDGSCIVRKDMPQIENPVILPRYEDILDKPQLLLDASLTVEKVLATGSGRVITQAHSKGILIHYPPQQALTQEDLDGIYNLPYSRVEHPSYKAPIHALLSVRDSVTVIRGCGGACTYCALGLHQGRELVSRSIGSVLQEIEAIKRTQGFQGHIKDLGGPTANLYGLRCRKGYKDCNRVSCLYPSPCPNLSQDYKPLLDLWREARGVKGIRLVTIGSGFRHELLNDEVLGELCRYHVSGHLKVAPEHVSKGVLDGMRRADFSRFTAFMDSFKRHSKASGKAQYLVPYFISGFPGCKLEDMRLAQGFLSKHNWKPQQVQAFLPSPGTIATAMYVAERDWRGRSIFVAKKDSDKRRQYNIFFR